MFPRGDATAREVAPIRRRSAACARNAALKLGTAATCSLAGTARAARILGADTGASQSSFAGAQPIRPSPSDRVPLPGCAASTECRRTDRLRCRVRRRINLSREPSAVSRQAPGHGRDFKLLHHLSPIAAVAPCPKLALEPPRNDPLPPPDSSPSTSQPTLLSLTSQREVAL